MKLLTEEEAAKLVNDDELKIGAVHNVEQNGIVFIDEIDKIASRQETRGADVSRQGVQRDLLPLGRRHHGVDQIRHDQDRPYPVHRERRLSLGQAVRSDPRIAGPLSDPR